MKTSVSPGAGGIAEGLAAAGGWQEAGREGGMISQAWLCHNQGERALQPSLPAGRGGNSVEPGKEAGGCTGCWGRKMKTRERREGCVCIKTVYLLFFCSIGKIWML